MNRIDLDRARLLGDRHLGPDLSDRLRPVNADARNVVRVSASPAVASTLGGQHALWMLVNLLARQFAVVHELQIAVPPLPVQPGVALFGGADNLVHALVRTGGLVAGAAMHVLPADENGGPCAADVVVGRAEKKSLGDFTVSVLGSGWLAFAGRPENTPEFLPVGRNAIGPYFAACLAAGEVFKYLRGLREGKGRYIDALYLSLWDFEARATWEALTEGEWRSPLVVPLFWLIGCGAVGQAVAAAITASGSVRGYGTTIDGENIDLKNLNRYPLATQADLGISRDHPGVSKSELTAAFLRRGGLEVYAYHGRWPEYASDSNRSRQRDDVRALEARYRYPMVLSCEIDRTSNPCKVNPGQVL